MKAIVQEIGPKAFSGTDKMVILFGETATNALKEYSVIQKFEEQNTLSMVPGDKLIINNQHYTITEVGPFANSNLNSISHTTLIFDEAPKEDIIVNGLYLEPYEIPTFEIGTIIEYVSSGE